MRSDLYHDHNEDGRQKQQERYQPIHVKVPTQPANLHSTKSIKPSTNGQ